ncbi:MAG: sensor histidine kinase [Ignavibacteria bacterium]|jgi:signal transduction histidine kinase
MWYYFLVLSFILWFSAFSLAGELDSLRNHLRSSSGTERVDVLNNIASGLKYVSTDSVLLYSQEALKLADDLDYLHGQSYSYSNMAFVHVYRGQKDSAYLFLEKALAIDSISGNKEDEAEHRLFYGNALMQFEEYEKASQSFIEALEYFEKTEDKYYTSKINGHLGIVFACLNDYQTSLEYFNKALTQYRKINDSFGVAMVTTNLGYLHLKLKKYNEAISYFKESLLFYKGKEYNSNLANLYSNMGECYTAMEEYNSALKYLTLAQEYLEKNSALNTQAFIYNHIADIYIKTGKLTEGKQYLKQAVDVANRIEHKTELITTYKLYHDYYLNTGDAKNAQLYFDKYVALKDSISNAERHEQVATLKTKYETEKKEKENAILQADLELKENDLAVQRRLIWFVSIIGLLLIAVGYFFNRSLKHKNVILQKENKIKEAEKETIKHETIAKQQVEFSQKLIEKQEEERERIAGELHDDIGQELLIAKNKLLLDSKNEPNNKSTTEVSEIISNVIEGLSIMSHNLSPLELEELGLTETISVMINRVENSSNIKFNLGTENIDTILDEKEQINLYRVIQEAVNNIIKHSKATTANLVIKRLDKEILIKISDNGIGFDNSGTGSDIDRPHFGLSGMKERVKLLHGEFNIFSEADSGTEIKISLPVDN